MILVGSQRAGGKQLAAHLMNGHENEHVEVHELRGFVGEDLDAAFHEAYAISRGTKAKQFLFSLSLNPPRGESVGIEVFEAAVDKAEARLGLSRQPRAIVFHEKDGRRHAHAVWSRIDASSMKAINMAHYKRKLREVGRELFLEHGWRMPRGFINSKERDPATYTLAEWQQAKRAGRDPKALKSLFQECWAASDSGKAFASALQARGFTLARGDRRGYVAVDYRGEVYGIAKYVGIRTKQVRECLGDALALPSVEEAKAAIREHVTDMFRRHLHEVEDKYKVELTAQRAALRKIVQRQREERATLARQQETRWQRETAERAQRLSKGLRGLWDRITGRYGKVMRRNEAEAGAAMKRDLRELDALVFCQTMARAGQHQKLKWLKESHMRQINEVSAGIGLGRASGSGKRCLQSERRKRVQGPGIEY